MTSRLWKNRRTTPSNTLLWNRRDPARLLLCRASGEVARRGVAAVLLASIVMPWAAADDAPSRGVKLKRRSNIQWVSAEESASDANAALQRWQQLKSRYPVEQSSTPAGETAIPQRSAKKPPAAETAIPQRSAKKPPILPIPEDGDVAATPADDDWLETESPRATDVSVTPVTSRPERLTDEPLPITEFEVEPAWIHGQASGGLPELPPFPGGELEAELAEDAIEPEAVADEDAETSVPPAATGQSRLNAVTKSQVADDPGYAAMPGASETRRPRPITAISPRYDRSVDQDIRQFAKEQAAEYGLAFGEGVYEPRSFYGLVYQWEPSNFHYYPLYFEDPQLERYGHTHGCVRQPIYSIARFSGQLLMLPYNMTLDPICAPNYPLGWYRPGDWAPKLRYQLPLNATAAAVEAGVVTGLFFAIP